MIGRLLCLLGFHDVWRWADDRPALKGTTWVHCRRKGCDW